MPDKKNKIKIIVTSLIVSASLATYAISAFASMSSNAGTAAAAGSADNPLVTLDYITNTLKPQLERDILAKINASGNNSVDNNNNNSNNNNNDIIVEQEPTPPVVSSASASYIVLELTRGQKLYAKTDSLEMIARPGTEATVISPNETQGLADLTTGEEILNGATLPINHALLIPRGDGRGVEITSAIAYILVRGEYEIK